jgi:hypothetical protein
MLATILMTLHAFPFVEEAGATPYDESVPTLLRE